MPRNLQEYDGRTIYSAAHLAGLELAPAKGHGPAKVRDLKLHFDPFLPPARQRSQFIKLLARRLESRGSGSFDDNIRELDAVLLPA